MTQPRNPSLSFVGDEAVFIRVFIELGGVNGRLDDGWHRRSIARLRTGGRERPRGGAVRTIIRHGALAKVPAVAFGGARARVTHRDFLLASESLSQSHRRKIDFSPQVNLMHTQVKERVYNISPL